MEIRYKNNEEVQGHRKNLEWAEGILSKPSITFLNGKNSHVVAQEVKEAALDGLIEHTLITG